MIRRLERISLEQQLPLILGTLLLGVALAIAVFSYAAFRRTSLGIAQERIVTVTNQFRDLFRQGVVQSVNRATTEAHDSVYARFASTPNADTRAAALKLLEYKGPQPEQVIASELRNAAGTVVLSHAPASRHDAPTPADDRIPRPPSDTRPATVQYRRTDSALVGPFQLLRDTLVYATAAPIPGTELRLVRWRRVVGARRSRDQINQLIGSDAALFLGNADGSAWTDLSKPSKGPPLDSSQKGPLQNYKRDGEDRVAASAAIPGTPWIVAVDVPRKSIFAPARAFLLSVTIIALVALLVALVIARVLSRRLTTPLVQLTAAADAIAVGDYTHAVDVRRGDELGRLGQSFQSMATQVRQLTGELEQRVAHRTADLKASNKELDAFAYAVSHDLRTPLRALDGFSQALLEDYADGLDETGKDYLMRIRRGSQRMGELIDALLELSRVARSDLRRESVDLTAMAREIIGALRERDPERAIETDVHSGLTITGDPRMLRALLENLLANAWKFTSKTKNARIDFHLHEDNGRGRVHVVRDNGAGFDMAYASKLFGAFQRLHDAREFEGTGVGLATVQRIVHRHGGTIWAEAAPNHGAAFYFTLD